MRQELNPVEALLWSRVKNRILGFAVRRQVPIGPYFLDFYVPSARLCIEVDGATHDLRPEHDRERDAFLLAQGIRTIRFRAADVLKDPIVIADSIAAIVAGRN